MTQSILLGFLGFTLLIFCIVDLWHLKQMLKSLREVVKGIQKLNRLTSL